jgi:hypothetical protein
LLIFFKKALEADSKHRIQLESKVQADEKANIQAVCEHFEEKCEAVIRF